MARPPDPTTGTGVVVDPLTGLPAAGPWTPIQSTTTVADGLARLTQLFRGKPVITAELGSFLRRVQEAEDATWDVVASRTLFQAAGVQLQTLCKIVGAPVLNTSIPVANTQMLISLFTQIAINRSSGRTSDFYKTLILHSALITEVYPATVIVHTSIGSLNVTPGITTATITEFTIVQQVKAAGVRVFVVYWPTFSFSPPTAPDAIFTFAPSTAPVSNFRFGFADSTNPGAFNGGHLAGVIAL